jgi:hypothetical protein
MSVQGMQTCVLVPLLRPARSCSGLRSGSCSRPTAAEVLHGNSADVQKCDAGAAAEAPRQSSFRVILSISCASCSMPLGVCSTIEVLCVKR